MRNVAKIFSHAVVLFVGALLPPTSVAADDLESITRQNERCESAMDSAFAAEKAEDWRRAEKFSRQAVQNCTDNGDASYDIVISYEPMIRAELEMGEFTSALASAEKCLDTYYQSPECHLYKVEALTRLKRPVEAKKARLVGISVCNSILEARAEREAGLSEHAVNMLKLNKRTAKRVLEVLNQTGP